MGDDSSSKGCGFESRCRILDGHFFTLNCKIVLAENKKRLGLAHFLTDWKRQKKEEKRPGMIQFFNFPKTKIEDIIFIFPPKIFLSSSVFMLLKSIPINLTTLGYF